MSELVWRPVPIPPPVETIEALAELPGTRLWYSDTGGSGPAIVLLHAAMGNPELWAYQQPELARAGYRVVNYARRGYYKSDLADQNDPGVGSEDLANLREWLGIDTMHLVANAAGGSVALDYVLSYPKRVTSLTLVSCMLGVVDQSYIDLGRSIRPKVFSQLPVEFQELGPSYRAGNPTGTAAWIERQKRSLRADFVMQKKTQPLTWKLVDSVGSPVLLVTGEADLYTPPSILRIQSAHFPQAEVHVFAEAGHHPEWEQPEAFNRILLAFLRKTFVLIG